MRLLSIPSFRRYEFLDLSCSKRCGPGKEERLSLYGDEDVGALLVVWTGCFPHGDSLQRLNRNTRRSIPATSSLASIGIEIGKEVFHIVGFSSDGKMPFVARSRLHRAKS